MNETYYVFNRYSLFRASVIGLSLPFFLSLIINLVNFNLYGYFTPWLWVLIASIPLLFIGYTVSLTVSQTHLTVERGFFGFTMIKSSHAIREDQPAEWRPSPKKKGIFILSIGNKDIGITIDR
jgi:hypothetical protein